MRSTEQNQPTLQDAEAVPCLPLRIHQEGPSGLSEPILFYHEPIQGQTRKGPEVKKAWQWVTVFCIASGGKTVIHIVNSLFISILCK